MNAAKFLERAQTLMQQRGAQYDQPSGERSMAAQRLHLSLIFYPPTRRAYDLDNLLARMKAGLDGLADVLGVDDSRWTLEISKSSEPTKGGLVHITITEQA